MRDPDPRLTATWFTNLARLEGVSLLVLFGVAMPLKYAAGIAEATVWTGWAHGCLFLVYLVALDSQRRVAGWSIGTAAAGFVASLLPFGTFVFERWVERR